jgi:hypothetical protein
MPNAIKYSTTGDTLSLKKGNIFFGVGDVGKGPSSATTYYNGVTPSGGGYTIYSYNASQTSNLSFHTAVSDAALITYTNGVSGQNFTTAIQCLNWYATQSNYACVNKDYEGIVTNGLVMNVDAGFIPSYPTNGTTWYDLSYNGNNISLTNGPIYDGGDGGSFIFDGSDDYGRNDIPNLPTGNVTTTICVWAYVLNTNSEWQGFAGWGNTTTGQSILLDMNNGRLALSTWGSLSSQDLISNYTVPNNSWRYLVGSINDKNMKLYADGVKVLDSSITSTPNVQSTNLRIATTDYPGRLLNTKISCVQVYNKELSQSEIIQNFNAGLSRFNTQNIVKNGLVLNLDSSNTVSYPTSGTTWTDLSGYGNKGTLTNGPTFDSTSKSIVFDGVDDYVVVSPSNELNTLTQFTYMACLNISSSDTYGAIIARSNSLVWYAGNTAVKQRLFIGGSDTGDSNTFLPSDRFSFICVTWDGTTVRYYFNGSPDGTATNTSSAFNTTPINIGRYQTGEYFQGKMSDIAIYNRSLSPTEIQQNYYQAPIVTSGLVMALDAGNLVSYLGSGTTWRDLTTNGNNGTLTNGPTFNSANGGSIDFDGTDDYISGPTLATNSLLSFTNGNFTLEHWIRITAYEPSTYFGLTNMIMSKGPASTYNYATQVTNSTTLSFIHRDNSEGLIFLNFTVPTITNNITQIVFSVTLTQVSLYLNGTLIESKSLTGNPITPYSNDVLLIGGLYDVSNTNFIGNMYLHRIYNRALTADEISQNYNAQKFRFGL